MHREKPNETVMPVPDVTLVSDGKGEDENIVNLEAVARAATAKLEKDLVDAKAQNDRIAQKKQERVDCLKKQKEDEEAAEVKKKVDEEARKKVPVQPLVSSVWSVLLGRKLTSLPDWAGCSTRERDSGAVQA